MFPLWWGRTPISGLGWITCTTNGLPAAPSRWRAHPGLRPKTRTYPLVRAPVGQGVWSAQNAVRWTNASVDLSSVLAIIGRKPPSLLGLAAFTSVAVPNYCWSEPRQNLGRGGS